jgi:dipeptidyl aminopeptidase/acylaminoacyl peptidase
MYSRAAPHERRDACRAGESAKLALMKRLVLLVLLTGMPLASAKRPVTHEDVWLMKRVGSPVVNPDGRWVVVSVTEPSYESDKQVSDLWIVPADGSAEPRRLTSTKGGEDGAVWSPDSRRLAFSAQREGDDASQIYVLSLDGGEAIRYTQLSTGAQNPKWSPDGNRLLFESEVYPGAGDDEANKKIIEERKKRKWNARIYDSFPIRLWDRWLPETRLHVFVMDAKPGATVKDLLAGTKFAAQPGFSGAAGLSSFSLQPVWAPDGKSIVITASLDRDRAAYAFTTTHLYRLSAEGGEPERMTSGADSYSGPLFRPDGRALYARFSRDPEISLHSNTLLAMIPWPGGGKPVILGAELDRSVGEAAFTPDGQTVYFLAEEAGHDKLFRMNAGGAGARRAFEMTGGGYAGLVVAEKASQPVLIATFQSTTSPAEVVRIDPAGGSHRALTQFNASRVAEISWQQPRHFWFASKGGVRIHNMMIVPPSMDPAKKYPLLVFMHGGPHNMWKDQFFLRWNFQYLAAQGYVVLMTNFSGSTGFGEKFADAINRDVLRLPAQEINEAADEAIRLFPFIDAGRQVAGGASYGGYLANWMQATTTRYKALFNHAGLTNNESMYGTTDGGYFWESRYGGPVWEAKGQWQEQNPLRFAANFRTPMLVTHGERDYRVPYGQALEVYKLLQRRRVPSKLIVFPEENHWILNGENNKFFFEELFAFLNHYVK